MKRYTIRALFVLITLFAVACALAALFVHENYTDWKRERAHMIGGAVRWDEDTYIPNLDLYCTSTLPAWMISWLPLEQQDVFDRVTTLDNTPGLADAEDFERCLAFEDVDTIYLGDVYDIEALAEVMKKFPRLKTVYYGKEFDEIGNKSIPETLRRKLPGVEITDDWPPS
jgi:hypothetical protein